MILYTYIAPGQGQTAPKGQSFVSTEMSCHFIHLLQVSKQRRMGQNAHLSEQL